jgi:cold shock CspA family protein
VSYNLESRTIIQKVIEKFGFVPASTKKYDSNGTFTSNNTFSDITNISTDNGNENTTPSNSKKKKKSKNKNKNKTNINNVMTDKADKTKHEKPSISSSISTTEADKRKSKGKHLARLGVQHGKILWVKETEGYGFIKVKTGEEYYFRVSEIYGEISVKPRDDVEFQVRTEGTLV